MQVIRTEKALREAVAGFRKENEKISFVPTMGHLHDGHMSLVTLAKQHAERVVVSIFVNPMQFNDASDLDKYPRTFEADSALLSDAGVDILFFPEVSTVYPDGTGVTTRVEVPGISDILEGEFRPGHFSGVTTVVCKLFNLVQPDSAVFGKKDYQQWLLIKRMTRDLNMPIEILAGDTQREANGLAMSSRNSHLSTEERMGAAKIREVLNKCTDSIRADVPYSEIKALASLSLSEAGFEPEYVAIKEQETLNEPQIGATRLVILVAARISSIRLIDNVELTLD